MFEIDRLITVVREHKFECYCFMTLNWQLCDIILFILIYLFNYVSNDNF